jgi:hypothetical protein
MKRKVWKLLYESFDRQLSGEERHLLDRAREEAKELRREEEQIRRQRRLLASGDPPSFAPGFADRVLARLGEEKKRFAANDLFYETLTTVFRRVALAAAALALVMVSYNIIRTGSVSVSGALAMAHMDMESSIAMYSTFNLE